jgi:integrase
VSLQIEPMKSNSLTRTPTLQTVIDRLGGNAGLSDTRKRDLRSAVISFAKIKGQPPAAVPLDPSDFRQTLDGLVPAAAAMSPKRWANLRSDLAAAIDSSGLIEMLKTADVELSPGWARLIDPAIEPRVRFGLSRFARWASLRGIAPRGVSDRVIARFIAELGESSLVRNLGNQHGNVAAAWKRLVALRPKAGLRAVSLPSTGAPKARLPWETLPRSFRNDVEQYLTWASVPDPLAEGARARALAPLSLRLQRTHVHSAASAAVAAGVPLEELTSLASLVEPETFRALLRRRWGGDGRKLSAYTHGIAVTLIAIASEWVKAPADQIASLKALRAKLGTLPTGLTEKNKALLRAFDDPRLVAGLVDLPDRLWRRARQGLATSRRPFIDLQSALAIDLLIHVPMRMQNLASLKFNEHLHWPQGRQKPGLITIRGDESKNDVPLEFEIPRVLADRLHVYRNQIAPTIIGKRPDTLFVSWTGKPRSQEAVKIALEKVILRHLGVKLTPHQFRHLAAKIALDANPGAYELVRQLLGHKNLKTTTRFYAGVDTRRAGRAHADLIMTLRESKFSGGRRRSSRAREG